MNAANPETQTGVTQKSQTRDKRIGIIGGGQLGQLLALAAKELNLETICIDPASNAPASIAATEYVCANYDDESALKYLNDSCDVITYEFENVPVLALEALKEGPEIYPPLTALAISQDRLLEKRFLADLNIATASFGDAQNREQLKSVVEQMLADQTAQNPNPSNPNPSNPGRGNRGSNAFVIAKTRRLGYDGKGQFRIASTTDESFEKAAAEIDNAAMIVEGFVEFIAEISVIATRSKTGQVVCFEPTRNHHKDGILARSVVPCGLSEKTVKAAQEITEKILKALQYVGTIGVEFFVCENNELLVNEFAPRVHNSGHWTEAGCDHSQFDLHIRAICGMALPTPERLFDCEMLNLIGDDYLKRDEIIAFHQQNPQEHIFLRDYGKEQVRAGRKMAHFTVTRPKTSSS